MADGSQSNCEIRENLTGGTEAGMVPRGGELGVKGHRVDSW